MGFVLKTTGLTKKFGSKIAVNDVNMTIEKGDIYGFIGKNGSGKTTLMRMVLGAAFPNSGSISLFEGEDPSKAKRRIGALIEAPGIYKSCTAMENMKRFSILFGGTDEDIKGILDFVGLGNTGRKKAGKFSLGMKQRLGIAIALLGQPEFLILDEPVNGLDPTGMKEIRDLILKLNREKGITVLISSHLLDELSKVVTKYGLINDGKLIEEISAKELVEKCKNKLKIVVDNPKKAYDILSQSIDKSMIEITENAVFLYTNLNDGAKINQLLSKNDVLVSGIELQSDGLENYFMERIGG